MARKKSAAKKAREQELKANIPKDELELKHDHDHPVPKDELELKHEHDHPVPKDELELKHEHDHPVPKDEIELLHDQQQSDSESEPEDEYGDLITEDVDLGIKRVLNAIKTNPKQLLDPKVKFFNDISPIDHKKDEPKPVYLKDYHRQNLLDGTYKEFDESHTVDGQKSFAIEQKEDRDQLLDDIKNAFNDDIEDDDDEEFLKKKEIKKSDHEPITKLPDPSTNETGFLSAFLDQKAWIPKSGDKVINLDKIDNNDEEDFDDAVETFEHAYNFRYEDPNSAEIVSYARNQATIRRSNTNSRKRQRDKKNEIKKQDEEVKQDLLKKKMTSKLNTIMDNLAKIKQAVGNEIDDETIQRVFGDSLLNDDFENTDWDSKMNEIFNEQYYEAEIEKPEWDDDDDIIGGEEDLDDTVQEVDEEPPTKKSKKDKLKQKKSAKKEKESLKEKAQQIIESNALKLMDEVEEERGRSKESEEVKFKYREVSPETFGLTTRDIILADDAQLNNFIGIKKFAPYRPKELRMKDKRKYTKKKHLQDWKKETFRNMAMPKDVKDDEIWIPKDTQNQEFEKKKKEFKKKKSNKSK